MKYLLKNGTVVTGEKSEQLDILVEGEKIVQVGKNLPSEDAQEIDLSYMDPAQQVIDYVKDTAEYIRTV